MISRETKFLVVGLGLIGGSYARALHKVGCSVTAIDLSPDTIGFALHEGIIDKGSTRVDESLIQEADVIILGLYPSTEIKWIQQYQYMLRPGTLLTDVSGVKTGVVDTIQNILRDDVELISCHPMAGKEVYGFRNSDESIFASANFIVVPTEKNSQQAIEDAIELGALLGFKKVSQLTMEKHDEIIGFVSQLTHIIAISLMTCNEDANLQDYTGDSFRDLTRIARINENMWTELFISNKTQLLKQLDDFTGELNAIRYLIESEDREELKEIMRYSTQRRALFDKK